MSQPVKYLYEILYKMIQAKMHKWPIAVTSFIIIRRMESLFRRLSPYASVALAHFQFAVDISFFLDDCAVFILGCNPH